MTATRTFYARNVFAAAAVAVLGTVSAQAQVQVQAQPQAQNQSQIQPQKSTALPFGTTEAVPTNNPSPRTPQ